MWNPPDRGRLVQTTWVLGRGTATPPRSVCSSAQMPREMRMNVRIFAAAALVAVLSVVAVGVSGASGGSAANTLTVWLQVDAQSGWPEVVAAANAQFKAQNPGWNVDVQYQTWGTHLSKFDATLAGGNCAGRHRDGEHGDDEVHGGRGVPGPALVCPSRTRAPGWRVSPPPVASAASSTASRTTRDRVLSPIGPTCSSRSTRRSRRARTSSSRWRGRSGRRTARSRSLPSTSPGPTGTSR